MCGKNIASSDVSLVSNPQQELKRLVDGVYEDSDDKDDAESKGEA